MVVVLLVVLHSDDHRALKACENFAIPFDRDAFHGPYLLGEWVCLDNNQEWVNVHAESPNNQHEHVFHLSRYRCNGSWLQSRPPHWQSR